MLACKNKVHTTQTLSHNYQCNSLCDDALKSPWMDYKHYTHEHYKHCYFTPTIIVFCSVPGGSFSQEIVNVFQALN